MRPSVIAVFLAIAIIIAVAFMWIIWGINLVDFTTGLSLFLISSIPVIFTWAWNSERKQKKALKISKKQKENFSMSLKIDKSIKN
jgi:ABC-type transport system involved in cytochrome bd biosynthesis fused ATPase/permease subunit